MTTNQPLRFAINGCGGRGTGFWLRRLLKNPDAQVVGLCDISPVPCQKAVDEHYTTRTDKPEIFTDPAKMLAQTRPDALVNVSAHAFHYEHCLQGLEAGCHIAVEKPMTIRLDHARDLVQRVERSEKVFQVAFNFPYSERSSGFRQQIRAGQYGRLQGISGFIAQPWLSLHRGTWRMRPELSGGGMVHDTGTHLLQAVLYLHPSDPVEVFAHIDTLETPVDINASIVIRFADGSLASVAILGNAAPACRIGLSFDTASAEFNSLQGHEMTLRDALGKPIDLPSFDWNLRHDQNFIQAIRTGSSVRTGVRDGLRVAEMLEAIFESAKAGGPVPVSLSAATEACA